MLQKETPQKIISVLVIFRDQTHVDWVKTWNDILNKTIAYIKEFHTTGLSWNPQVNERGI